MFSHIGNLHGFVNKVINKPTRFRLKGRDYNGCDCWGLIYLGYKEVLDIDLPSYDNQYVSAKPSRELASLFQVKAQKDDWILTDTPRLMDVVLFRMNGTPTHCGLIVGRKTMLHIMYGTEACLERWNSPLWKNRLAGFWRKD